MNRSIIAARFLAHRKDDPEIEPVTDVNEHWSVPSGTIDVWWRGMENGALMMLLGHLLHNNTGWRNNPIRVLRIVDNEEARVEVEKHIIELGASSRIPVTPKVIVSKQPVGEVIQAASRDAAIVLLGLESPDEGQESELYHRMETMAGELPRVLYINSAGGMELES